jgi:hypothetical protein
MSETGWSYQVVELSASASPLVAGTSGKKIRVLSAVLVAGNSGSIWRFATSTGPSGLTGNLPLIDGVPVVLPHSPTGWFETEPGDDLDLLTSSTPADVHGAIVYELV